MAIAKSDHLFIYVTVVLVSLIQSQIDYVEKSLNNWACTEGLRQSPVTFSVVNSTYSDKLGIINDAYNAISNSVVRVTSNNVMEIVSFSNNANWGHVLIEYFGYIMKFDLKQIVIHSPIEHDVDVIKADVEVQLIHQKDLDFTSDVNKFQKKPDVSEFLVISVPFAVNGTIPTEGNLIEILSGAYSDNLAQTTGVNIPLNTLNLVRGKRFFFYSGSQTIYPCNESHLHILISDITIMTELAREKFKGVFLSKFVNSINTKKTTTLGARSVIRNFFTSQLEQKTYEDPIALAESTKREDAAKQAKIDCGKNCTNSTI